ncbi:MAG: hypothetical protein NTY19_17515 [Planctomycetota bacterium]|nr:hypothetical protein [Planctomycetota bacterium]
MRLFGKKVTQTSSPSEPADVLVSSAENDSADGRDEAPSLGRRLLGIAIRCLETLATVLPLVVQTLLVALVVCLLIVVYRTTGPQPQMSPPLEAGANGVERLTQALDEQKKKFEEQERALHDLQAVIADAPPTPLPAREGAAVPGQPAASSPASVSELNASTKSLADQIRAFQGIAPKFEGLLVTHKEFNDAASKINGIVEFLTKRASLTPDDEAKLAKRLLVDFYKYKENDLTNLKKEMDATNVRLNQITSAVTAIQTYVHAKPRTQDLAIILYDTKDLAASSYLPMVGNIVLELARPNMRVGVYIAKKRKINFLTILPLTQKEPPQLSLFQRSDGLDQEAIANPDDLEQAVLDSIFRTPQSPPAPAVNPGPAKNPRCILILPDGLTKPVPPKSTEIAAAKKWEGVDVDVLFLLAGGRKDPKDLKEQLYLWYAFCTNHNGVLAFVREKEKKNDRDVPINQDDLLSVLRRLVPGP